MFFEGNASLILRQSNSINDKIIQAKNYWSGDKTNLISEYLFVGKAKVLEVTDINE